MEKQEHTKKRKPILETYDQYVQRYFPDLYEKQQRQRTEQALVKSPEFVDDSLRRLRQLLAHESSR